LAHSESGTTCWQSCGTRQRTAVTLAFPSKGRTVRRALLPRPLRQPPVSNGSGPNRIVGGMSLAAGLRLWAAAFYVAAHEWPNTPVTSWFL
jgi:hypothetical protein